MVDDPAAIGRPASLDEPELQARRVLRSATSFLLADAEAYRARMGRGQPPDGWVFTPAVAEWAYLNDTELARVADLLGAG